MEYQLEFSHIPLPSFNSLGAWSPAVEAPALGGQPGLQTAGEWPS